MAYYYISQVINGICQGSIYALMAIGYSVVVGMTNLVTFAFGEIIMIGADVLVALLIVALEIKTFKSYKKRKEEEEENA